MPNLRPSVFTNLRALPPAAWVLFGGTFINRFGTFVMPFLVIYMTRQGYSVGQAGIAVSAYGAGHIMASMLGGHLADSIGRRHTIALSMFASAGAMIALSQARSYGVLLVLTVLAGAAAELYRPASTALIGDLVTPEQRVAAFAMYRFAVNLGFAAGPATAGFIAEQSFQSLFVIDAVTSVAYGLVALFALPHGLRGQSKGERASEGIRVALRDRRFVLFLLATLTVTWTEFQIHTTLPLYMQTQGLSITTYGLLMSINGLMIVFLELALTSWTQRFPAQWMIAAGYGLSALGFACTGLAHTVPALAATVVLWTLGEMIYAPVTGAYVIGLAPERYRGRYTGLWVMMWSCGMLIGPALGTFLFQRNPAYLWTACAVAGVTSAALALIRVRT